MCDHGGDAISNDLTKVCVRQRVRSCRCEDMVDVRRLKMLQMVQLFKCEEDALQVRCADESRMMSPAQVL